MKHPLPPIDVLKKHFRIKNRQLISIRSGKRAGGFRNGAYQVMIAGIFYAYDDVLDAYMQGLKTEHLGIHAGLFKTAGGFNARVYATDGAPPDCIHGAIFFDDLAGTGWSLTSWSATGQHEHLEYSLAEELTNEPK